MENKDFQKKLTDLEKRIKELESKLKDNLGMFGRSYALAGNSSSDFLIKTRGLVKIQWGNKFIDLIKDGKLNVDTKIIYTVGSKEEIGNKEGIYVTSDNAVYLKIGSNEPINLAGEVGTTYVSFLQEQITKSEEKYTALKNIGLIYPSIKDLDENSLKNGIIYVENELKLYVINNGLLLKFTIEFPNPFTNLFVIAKTGTQIGSLVIQGEGINNSIAFDTLYIFTEKGESFLRANKAINISVDDKKCIEITLQKTSIKNILEVNNIRSPGVSDSSGFSLASENGEYTLTIDNLVVRNSESSNSYNPIEWSYGRNVITEIGQYGAEASANAIELKKSVYDYYIILLYENTYKKGDLLYFYADIKPVYKEETSDSGETYLVESIGEVKLVKIPVQVISVPKEAPKEILVLVIKEIFPENIFLSGENIKCSGRIISLLKTDAELSTIRYSDKAIDIITCNDIKDEENISSIISRKGDLTELGLKEGIKENREVAITGNGDYTKQGYFSKAGYISSYNLPDEDDSTKMASTEWVRRLFNNIVPKGAIMAFHGNTPPSGWVICDGNNGTPNLIGKFIKGDTTESEGDEIKISLLSSQVGTNQQTVKIDPKYYSLVFIMKIE